MSASTATAMGRGGGARPESISDVTVSRYARLASRRGRGVRTNGWPLRSSRVIDAGNGWFRRRHAASPWACMALPLGTYAPRDPAASVLYQVVRDHYQTFRAEATRLRDGEGLPRFVAEEFAAFLRCGWLAGGFALQLHALPRGAAGGVLVQGSRVLSELRGSSDDRAGGPPRGPRVARGTSQAWALSLPPLVRYGLAWRHDLCTAVAGVLHRAVHRHLGSWAHTRGLGDARSEAVIVVQRLAARSISIFTSTRSSSTASLRAPGTAGYGSTGRRRPPAWTWRTCWRQSCQACGRGSRGVGSTRTATRARTGSSTRRRGWPGWRRRQRRVCWRWAGCRGGGRSGWAGRMGQGRAARVGPTYRMRGGRDSICMRRSRSRATGRGWSACVATSCGRR
jgi:hypothetical protein